MQASHSAAVPATPSPSVATRQNAQSAQNAPNVHTSRDTQSTPPSAAHPLWRNAGVPYSAPASARSRSPGGNSAAGISSNRSFGGQFHYVALTRICGEQTLGRTPRPAGTSPSNATATAPVSSAPSGTQLMIPTVASRQKLGEIWHTLYQRLSAHDKTLSTRHALTLSDEEALHIPPDIARCKRAACVMLSALETLEDMRKLGPEGRTRSHVPIVEKALDALSGSRNDSKNIEKLLKRLDRLDYPKHAPGDDDGTLSLPQRMIRPPYRRVILSSQPVGEPVESKGPDLHAQQAPAGAAPDASTPRLTAAEKNRMASRRAVSEAAMRSPDWKAYTQPCLPETGAIHKYSTPAATVLKSAVEPAVEAPAKPVNAQASISPTSGTVTRRPPPKKRMPAGTPPLLLAKQQLPQRRLPQHQSPQSPKGLLSPQSAASTPSSISVPRMSSSSLPMSPTSLPMSPSSMPLSPLSARSSLSPLLPFRPAGAESFGRRSNEKRTPAERHFQGSLRNSPVCASKPAWQSAGRASLSGGNTPRVGGLLSPENWKGRVNRLFATPTQEPSDPTSVLDATVVKLRHFLAICKKRSTAEGIDNRADGARAEQAIARITPIKKKISECATSDTPAVKRSHALAQAENVRCSNLLLNLNYAKLAQREHSDAEIGHQAEEYARSAAVAKNRMQREAPPVQADQTDDHAAGPSWAAAAIKEAAPVIAALIATQSKTPPQPARMTKSPRAGQATPELVRMESIEEENGACGYDDPYGEDLAASSPSPDYSWEAGHASKMAIKKMVDEYEQEEHNQEERIWTKLPGKRGTWGPAEGWDAEGNWSKLT